MEFETPFLSSFNRLYGFKTFIHDFQKENIEDKNI